MAPCQDRRAASPAALLSARHPSQATSFFLVAVVPEAVLALSCSVGVIVAERRREDPLPHQVQVPAWQNMKEAQAHAGNYRRNSQRFSNLNKASRTWRRGSGRDPLGATSTKKASLFSTTSRHARSAIS